MHFKTHNNYKIGPENYAVEQRSSEWKWAIICSVNRNLSFHCCSTDYSLLIRFERERKNGIRWAATLIECIASHFIKLFAATGSQNCNNNVWFWKKENKNTHTIRLPFVIIFGVTVCSCLIHTQTLIIIVRVVRAKWLPRRCR